MGAPREAHERAALPRSVVSKSQHATRDKRACVRPFCRACKAFGLGPKGGLERALLLVIIIPSGKKKKKNISGIIESSARGRSRRQPGRFAERTVAPRRVSARKKKKNKKQQSLAPSQPPLLATKRRAGCARPPRRRSWRVFHRRTQFRPANPALTPPSARLGATRALNTTW